MPKKRQPRPKKGKVTSLGWAKPDDPIYTNAGKPVKGKVTSLGLLPDDDAIYQDGGFLWRFVMGTYLNPHIKSKKDKEPR